MPTSAEQAVWAFLGACGAAWCIRRRRTCSSVSNLLTVIVTTSPIRSHPSCMLLETLLASFQLVPGLLQCRIIVVCDGYNVTSKQNLLNPRYRRRRWISKGEADAYEAFVHRIVQHAGGACHGGVTPDLYGVECTKHPELWRNVEVMRLARRHGFALALRAGLERVRTEFVLVAQHDWGFVRPVPLLELLHTMNTRQSTLKYVGFPSTSSLGYADFVLNRYRLDLEPHRLHRADLAPFLAGHNGKSVAKDAGSAAGVAASADKEHTDGAHPGTEPGATLIPLLFWFDKTHVCRTEHYRNFLFRRAYFLRDGDFIEDTFGHRELDDIKANGLGAHAKYGTFLYERNDGLELLAHMDGRRFLTPDQRETRGMPRNGGRLHVAEALERFAAAQQTQ